MHIGINIKIALGVVAGLLLGGVISDVATSRGFPYGKYLVEFKYDGSSKAAFACARRGSALGENFSGYDFESQVQTDCLLLVSGAKREDGSFDAYPGTHTWRGRISNASLPVNIPASQIKSVRPADF